MWQHWDTGRVEPEAICSIRRVVEPSTFDARGIIIEGDAANVIDFCIKHVGRTARSAMSPMEGDLTFLGDFSAVRFQHVGRRANRAADYCARLAVGGDFLWVAGCDADAGFQTLVIDDRRVLDGV
ncbi:hypothetical protein KSP40_PGU004727 [Platanthera guangdongensis]|uniref:RNase H type-1 domain-containing protein n=1 Tax=Platanthera guangdongensis TaxID=2320717 RepID=A0ABR2MM26_9ASPA